MWSQIYVFFQKYRKMDKQKSGKNEKHEVLVKSPNEFALKTGIE